MKLKSEHTPNKMPPLPRRYRLPFPIDGLQARTAPIFRRWGFTPNTLTTASLLTGLAAIGCLLALGPSAASKRTTLPSRQRALAVASGFLILFWLSRYFDTMDGYYARRYKMVTPGGDWYDHVVDKVVQIGLLVALFWRFRLWHHHGCLALLVLAYFAQLMYMGCKEYYLTRHGTAANPSMRVARRMCAAPLRAVMGDDRRHTAAPPRHDTASAAAPEATTSEETGLRTMLRVLRWVGPSTQSIVHCGVVLYLIWYR